MCLGKAEAARKCTRQIRQLADKITNYAPTEEIRALLICGAQPDGEVTGGLRPLHYACFINNVSAARLLLNRGAKPDGEVTGGLRPLHYACFINNVSAARLLLNRGAKYTDVVQQYEEAVMDKNGKYPSRENIDEPLRLAIKNGHYECARLLLENGASANAIYFDGPEITVVSPLDTNFIELLNGHYECARLLLENGASANAIYFDGPEITVVSPLDTNFIELLLEYGADPNVYDRKGLTPIMKACRLKENGIEAIRILHKYGGNVNAQAEARQDFRTPMHYALLSGSAELVKFLISLGAKVTMPKGYEKPSIIDIAVLKDDPELLKIIIDAGADINAVHTYIGSALHLAACSVLQNQYDILRLLLEAGADPNMQHRFPDGSQLKSPFVEYFRSRDTVDPRVVHLLLAYGGKVVMRSPAVDMRGQLRNVLRLAATREQPQVLLSMLDLGEEFDVRAIDRLPLPVALKGEILERAKNPATLQQICRLTLRSKITPFRPDVISRLPIPAHMKDYVLGKSH
ncbi:unnamed protein product [Strongylus vulgaris]|uniref:SOCS box domain-containing protein n=1 Tax=Strongylus vulgaris TaxID=40348 RepID=A0A3P7LE50_STRVU|nr:unnamed protein product [Strongylus vulgaris]